MDIGLHNMQFFFKKDWILYYDLNYNSKIVMKTIWKKKIPTVPVGEVPAHIRARIQIGNFPQEKRQPQLRTQTLVTQM